MRTAREPGVEEKSAILPHGISEVFGENIQLWDAETQGNFA